MDDPPTNPARRVVQRLESLKRAGVTHLSKAQSQALLAQLTEQSARTATLSATEGPPVMAKKAAIAPTASTSSPAPPPVQQAPAPRPAVKPAGDSSLTGAGFEGAPLSPAERMPALAVVNQEVKGCMRCSELCHARTNTVFGSGNVSPRLVFMGEAPGADEDAQGLPFVGKAGQLLTKIIEACTLNREDVYILNVLKCRPPGNRVPLPGEVENCRGYFERQFAILRPEYICCLGATAAKALLDTTSSMGALRGRLHDYRGIPVLCTYHPSYLLRNPAAKKDVWADMQFLMREMGIDLPGKAGE